MNDHRPTPPAHPISPDVVRMQTTFQNPLQARTWLIVTLLLIGAVSQYLLAIYIPSVWQAIYDLIEKILTLLL